MIALYLWAAASAGAVGGAAVASAVAYTRGWEAGLRDAPVARAKAVQRLNALTPYRAPEPAPVDYSQIHGRPEHVACNQKCYDLYGI